MGKSDRGDVHAQLPRLSIGSLVKVKHGQQGNVSFIATGSLVRMAMEIASESYPDITVWSVPFIKPMDDKQVAVICAQSRGVVVLEEHSVLGGVGSAIAEISADLAPVRILRIGVQDRFSQHCGSYEYLLMEHGMDRITITKRIEAFIKEI
jgi:transketolase